MDHVIGKTEQVILAPHGVLHYLPLGALYDGERYLVEKYTLAYIPSAKVLGISKLSRLVTLMASQPTLQEDMTHELCRIMHDEMDSDGAAVYVEGLHMCMAARGARKHESRVVTSAVRGVFLKLETREEFMKLVTAPPPPLL